MLYLRVFFLSKIVFAYIPLTFCQLLRRYFHPFKDDGQKVGWGKPYLTSKQLCLERSQLLLPPESYCQSNKHQNEGILSWTNVFRAQTEAKLTKGNTTKNVIFYIFVLGVLLVLLPLLNINEIKKSYRRRASAGPLTTMCVIHKKRKQQ